MDTKRVRPQSPNAQELPGQPQQPKGPNPAKRPRLENSSCPRALAQLHLIEPSMPTSEELTSIVCLGTGCTLKLILEDVDLLLEPEPTSVMQVSLPGHTIILVPEALQSLALPAQPGFCPSGSQEASVLDMPRGHGISSQQASSSASLPDTEGLGSTYDPREDSLEGFLRPLPWMNAPAGMIPAFFLPFNGVSSPMFHRPVPCRWGPGAPPESERYAPGSIWSLQSSMLEPLPSSPLQPLPPSPPQSHQEGPRCPLKPPRPRCRAQRRLF